MSAPSLLDQLLQQVRDQRGSITWGRTRGHAIATHFHYTQGEADGVVMNPWGNG